jgi:hypothetical protein
MCFSGFENLAFKFNLCRYTKENGMYYAGLVFFDELEDAVRAPWTEDELEAQRAVVRKALEKEEKKKFQVCKCGATTHARPSSALCPLNKKNALKCLCVAWLNCGCGKREAERAACPCESVSACVCGLGKREAAQRTAWYNAVGRKEEEARRRKREGEAARLERKAVKEAAQLARKAGKEAGKPQTFAAVKIPLHAPKRKLPCLTGPMSKARGKPRYRGWAAPTPTDETDVY